MLHILDCIKAIKTTFNLALNKQTTASDTSPEIKITDPKRVKSLIQAQALTKEMTGEKAMQTYNNFLSNTPPKQNQNFNLFY